MILKRNTFLLLLLILTASSCIHYEDLVKVAPNNEQNNAGSATLGIRFQVNEIRYAYGAKGNIYNLKTGEEHPLVKFDENEHFRTTWAKFYEVNLDPGLYALVDFSARYSSISGTTTYI